MTQSKEPNSNSRTAWSAQLNAARSAKIAAAEYSTVQEALAPGSQVRLGREITQAYGCYAILREDIAPGQWLGDIYSPSGKIWRRGAVIRAEEIESIEKRATRPASHDHEVISRLEILSEPEVAWVKDDGGRLVKVRIDRGRDGIYHGTVVDAGEYQGGVSPLWALGQRVQFVQRSVQFWGSMK